MNLNKFLTIILFLICKTILTQDLVPLTGLELNPNIDINLETYGYVKLDTFFDTNQVIASGDDHLIIAPAPVILDPLGRNINSRGQFGMTAIESRFGMKLSADKWSSCNFKAKARIEGDFIGTSEETTGSFRMRHAYGKIIKPNNYSILFGQYWHPLFITDCYPHTLSHDDGVPIDTHVRNPQLRYTGYFDSLEIILAILAQQAYPSPGPCGLDSRYQRDSLTPIFHAQLKQYWGDNLIGSAIDYKRLVPRLATDKCYKTNSSVNSIIAEVFGKIEHKSLIVRSKLIYAQNGADQKLLGGYGVATLDPATDTKTYEAISAVSAWLDFSKLFGKHLEVGAFIGGISKLDNKNRFYIDPKTNNPIIYDLKKELRKAKSLFQVSPRIIWAYDPIRFGFELIYKRAEYGQFNNYANLVNLVPAHNIRFLSAIYYLF